MQVQKHAQQDGLHVYVAVVAAVKGTAAAARCEGRADVTAQKYAAATSIHSAGDGYFALVMQHCTGPATRAVFLQPTVSQHVTAGADTAVRTMISTSAVRASESMLCT